MAFSLAPAQVFSPPISTSSSSNKNKLLFRKISAYHQKDSGEESASVNRRNVTLGLGGALLALSMDDKNAKAAGKRAPPPPPKEKKDLSMTALQAKVMANKKRREAMKEEVARLRERGKPITIPSN